MNVNYDKLNKEGRLLILPPISETLNSVTERKYGSFSNRITTNTMCHTCPIYDVENGCQIWKDGDCYVDRKVVLDMLNAEMIGGFPE